MTFRGVFAEAIVTDLARAETWYSVLFERGPDTRPMEGLILWRLGDAFGVQVWLRPDRAGRSAMVLDVSDIDGVAARLTDAGFDHAGPEQVTASRILQLTDPDGNQIVLSEA